MAGGAGDDDALSYAMEGLALKLRLWVVSLFWRWGACRIAGRR